ncbi:alpha/beta hydrolase [Asticcacaulis benevestitus]|uniref:Serine aminopeptidase S33 domain-containing protein n=1 Tax=Asticcacaulis benevestitus DSM 16100 = ATCC BAA-896 TaxID=1121022 RepID=V4PQ51_9CAUL|nr:alpha/beta fold hydrolase [Asticcacaulis benevestitus]ESQ87600.1 hypothetical protein ABENE_17185 [Asticcacaulis benevestitus DSM 16100 = ATCC BAA-896]
MSPLDITLRKQHRKAVILVHGLTGAPDEMRYLAKKLSDHGYDVYVPLLSGHGGAYANVIRTGWRDWLQTLTLCYDRIAPDYDHIHVAGICVGGMLGLMLASQRTLSSCTVYSAVFEFDGWSMPRHYAILRAAWPLIYLLPPVGSIIIPETYPFGLKDERLRTLAATSQDSLIKGALDGMPLKSIADMYRLGRAVLDIAPTLNTPTLIIHAEEDEIGSVKNAHRLKSALGPQARLAILNDSYHMIHVDRERSKVVALTLEALGYASEALDCAHPGYRVYA